MAWGHRREQRRSSTLSYPTRLMEVSSQHYSPANLISRKKADIYWKYYRMGPRTRLNILENRKISWTCCDSNPFTSPPVHQRAPSHFNWATFFYLRQFSLAPVTSSSWRHTNSSLARNPSMLSQYFIDIGLVTIFFFGIAGTQYLLGGTGNVRYIWKSLIFASRVFFSSVNTTTVMQTAY